MGLDLLGPAATVMGSGEAAEWLSAFLGAPGLRIGGGTDEVQKNIIGERVLGLPGDRVPTGTCHSLLEDDAHSLVLSVTAVPAADTTTLPRATSTRSTETPMTAWAPLARASSTIAIDRILSGGAETEPSRLSAGDGQLTGDQPEIGVDLPLGE